jgi:hypothetical protein
MTTLTISSSLFFLLDPAKLGLVRSMVTDCMPGSAVAMCPERSVDPSQQAYEIFADPGAVTVYWQNLDPLKAMLEEISPYINGAFRLTVIEDRDQEDPVRTNLYAGIDLGPVKDLRLKTAHEEVLASLAAHGVSIEEYLQDASRTEERSIDRPRGA